MRAVVTLTGLLLFSSGFAAENDALKLVPADSLFCVQVNNFEYSLSRMDGFLAGLAPTPMTLQMGARMALSQLLGGPQLEGLNMKGSFVIFAGGYDNQDPDKMMTFIVPITDFKQLVSSNPNLSEADANGIVSIQNVGGVVAQAGDGAGDGVERDIEVLGEILRQKAQHQAAVFLEQGVLAPVAAIGRLV